MRNELCFYGWRLQRVLYKHITFDDGGEGGGGWEYEKQVNARFNVRLAMLYFF